MGFMHAGGGTTVEWTTCMHFFLTGVWGASKRRRA